MTYKVPSSKVWEDSVFTELANIYNTTDKARELLLRAGWPPSQIPPFKNSEDFWEKVKREIGHGTHLAACRLAEAAAKRYPRNAILTSYAGDSSASFVSRIGRPLAKLKQWVAISLVLLLGGLSLGLHYGTDDNRARAQAPSEGKSGTGPADQPVDTDDPDVPSDPQATEHRARPGAEHFPSPEQHETDDQSNAVGGPLPPDLRREVAYLIKTTVRDDECLRYANQRVRIAFTIGTLWRPQATLISFPPSSWEEATERVFGTLDPEETDADQPDQPDQKVCVTRAIDKALSTFRQLGSKAPSFVELSIGGHHVAHGGKRSPSVPRDYKVCPTEDRAELVAMAKAHQAAARYDQAILCRVRAYDVCVNDEADDAGSRACELLARLASGLMGRCAGELTSSLLEAKDSGDDETLDKRLKEARKFINPLMAAFDPRKSRTVPDEVITDIARLNATLQSIAEARAHRRSSTKSRRRP